MLSFHARPGDVLEKGQPIASCLTLLGEERGVVTAPDDGIVVGSTTLPSVKPGDPVCHFGSVRGGIRPILKALQSSRTRAFMSASSTTWGAASRSKSPSPPDRPSLSFSPILYCNAVSARICCTLLGRPSSAYFEYACGDLGRKALQLQTSTAFRDEAGENALAFRVGAASGRPATNDRSVSTRNRPRSARRPSSTRKPISYRLVRVNSVIHWRPRILTAISTTGRSST